MRYTDRTMFDHAGDDRLRVRFDDASGWDITLTDRLSVGSAETCDVVIPAHGLLPLHFVVERIHDEWALSCFNAGAIENELGQSTRRLSLAPGSRFTAGSARFELIGGARVTGIQGTINGRCAACGFEVNLLAVRARYCPRCGTLVQEPDAAGMALPVVPVEPNHSEILNGYASALTHLGGKYEENRPHNEREAVRCYLKAAKLGSGEAQEKLAQKGIEPVAPEKPKAP
jgi:hypothetical protein